MEMSSVTRTPGCPPLFIVKRQMETSRTPSYAKNHKTCI